MDAPLLAFSGPQLAVICTILGGAVVWGFTRLINSIDGRFTALDKRISDLQEQLREYPTRHEMNNRIRSTERRIDDLALFVHTRGQLPAQPYGVEREESYE